MNIKIMAAYEPITEDKLSQFEKELGRQLPQDYRQFLLRHNGGKPNPGKFSVDIDGFRNTTVVQRFLGFHDTDADSFSRYSKIYENRIPDNLLPIATELSVDLICISINGDDYGKVYYWDHNWEVTEGKPDYSNVHILANSFTEFLGTLYDDDTLGE
jgi:cell wall assembly regulator SMI1